MRSLLDLAARLRRNAATAMHGETAADIRVAAEIVETVGNLARFEYLGAARFRDRETKALVSPRVFETAFRDALRIAEACA